jgi:hypothetical protein
MNQPGDQRVQWPTGGMGLLTLIAGTVSYLHLLILVELHGQRGWAAALTPLSVDGTIVATSTTLLADSRAGQHRGRPANRSQACYRCPAAVRPHRRYESCSCAESVARRTDTPHLLPVGSCHP